jgi:hypothetical protein
MPPLPQPSQVANKSAKSTRCRRAGLRPENRVQSPSLRAAVRDDSPAAQAKPGDPELDVLDAMDRPRSKHWASFGFALKHSVLPYRGRLSTSTILALMAGVVVTAAVPVPVCVAAAELLASAPTCDLTAAAPFCDLCGLLQHRLRLSQGIYGLNFDPRNSDQIEIISDHYTVLGRRLSQWQ